MYATAISVPTLSDSHNERYTSIRPLLETTLAQTNAQGVYLYRFFDGDPQLVLWSGLSPWSKTSNEDPSGSREHGGRTAPIVVYDEAWRDTRFQRFPEFRKNRFEGIASIPLIEAGSTIGLLNVGRLRGLAWKPAELAFVLNLSLPLGALLAAAEEHESMQRQLDDLSRQLADRKLFERAKGLLQARQQWTEEQSYLHIRRASRQRRVPMRTVAIEIIETGGNAIDEAVHHAG